MGRGTETEEALRARLSAALDEIHYARTGKAPEVDREASIGAASPKTHEKGEAKAVDYVIVNDRVERAYLILESLALGEESVESDDFPSF